MDTPTLGIDFGTTKTLVSYFNPQINRPDPIRLGRGTDYLPTTVFVTQDGGFLFGDDADDEMPHDAKRYSRGFKMRLGTPVSAIGFFDGTRYIKYTAKELTRAFLTHIREECERLVFVGKSVHRAVITCPVSFSPAQRAELEDAAHLAGFSEVTLVTEPEAAGLAFCKLCPETCFKGNALVVDWGGGTLDMALVSREGSHVSTHSEYTAGNIEMGGEVFDMRLYNHIARQLLSESGIDLKQEKSELQGMLLRRVRAGKVQLSDREQCTIRLSSSQGAYPPVKVTRSEFEQLIAEDVAQAAHMATLLNESIADARIKPEMILLVGGSSRIPCIAKTLEQSVGLPCHPWQYSQEAVSLGAAWIAAEGRDESQEKGTAQKHDSSHLLHDSPPPQHELQQENEPVTESFRLSQEYGTGLNGTSCDFARAAKTPQSKSNGRKKIEVEVHWSYISDNVPFPLKYGGNVYYLKIHQEGSLFFPEIGESGIVIHVTKTYQGNTYDRSAIPQNAKIYVPAGSKISPTHTNSIEKNVKSGVNIYFMIAAIIFTILFIFMVFSPLIAISPAAAWFCYRLWRAALYRDF